MTAVLAPERAHQLVDDLHDTWHAAPGDCRGKFCEYRHRAESVVRVIGPTVAAWLVADLGAARASIYDTWGLCDQAGCSNLAPHIHATAA